MDARIDEKLMQWSWISIFAVQLQKIICNGIIDKFKQEERRYLTRSTGGQVLRLRQMWRRVECFYRELQKYLEM